MGNELLAGSHADDLAQIERDWMLAQARIDELTETGKRAIQRLVLIPGASVRSSVRASSNEPPLADQLTRSDSRRCSRLRDSGSNQRKVSAP